MFCTNEFDPYRYDDYHDNDKVVAQQLRDDFVHAACREHKKEAVKEVEDLIEQHLYPIKDDYLLRFRTADIDYLPALQKEYCEWFEEIAVMVAENKYPK